jgi:hypothetical protein
VSKIRLLQESNSGSSNGWWTGTERSTPSLLSLASPIKRHDRRERSKRGEAAHVGGIEGGNDRLLLEIGATIFHLEFNFDHLEQPREFVDVLWRDALSSPHVIVDRHHEETVLLANHLHRVQRNIFLIDIHNEDENLGCNHI